MKCHHRTIRGLTVAARRVRAGIYICAGDKRLYAAKEIETI